MAGPLKDTIKKNNQEEFIKYGFISIVINGKERPQCVKCCEVLANESFKVNEFIRHQKTNTILWLIPVHNFLKERLKL
jgi:hypothetical protein